MNSWSSPVRLPTVNRTPLAAMSRAETRKSQQGKVAYLFPSDSSRNSDAFPRNRPYPKTVPRGRARYAKRDDIGADRPASQQGPRLLHEVGNDGVIDVQEGEIFPTGGRDSSIARSGDPGVPW